MIEIKTFVVGFLETNCYLVYDNNSKIGFLVDPGVFDKRIANTIKKKKIRVKNIINTHGHDDHAAGNSAFGYPVLIHQADSSLLGSPRAGDVRFLKDGDVIKEGDIRFEVIHIPGHTPGSIGLKLSDKIFTGDTLFCGGIGRTDLPGGNERDLFHSIKNKLMTLPDNTVILPGHGSSSTIGNEKKNNTFLT